MTSTVTSRVTSTADVPTSEPDDAPPPFVERTLGALVADPLLREAVLGDLAEGFAAYRARHGPVQARRWYRLHAARSAPGLLSATWWPAPSRRPRRLGALLAAGGGLVLLQLLHQAAKFLVTLVLASAGVTGSGWPLVAGSLVPGAGCAVLAGAFAARAVRAAPLAGALALAGACGALALTGMLANGGAGPLWYWGGLQLVVLPADACAGGLLRITRATAGDAHADGTWRPAGPRAHTPP